MFIILTHITWGTVLLLVVWFLADVFLDKWAKRDAAARKFYAKLNRRRPKPHIEPQLFKGGDRAHLR